MTNEFFQAKLNQIEKYPERPFGEDEAGWLVAGVLFYWVYGRLPSETELKKLSALETNNPYGLATYLTANFYWELDSQTPEFEYLQNEN